MGANCRFGHSRSENCGLTASVPGVCTSAKTVLSLQHRRRLVAQGWGISRGYLCHDGAAVTLRLVFRLPGLATGPERAGSGTGVTVQSENQAVKEGLEKQPERHRCFTMWGRDGGDARQP